MSEQYELFPELQRGEETLSPDIATDLALLMGTTSRPDGSTSAQERMLAERALANSTQKVEIIDPVILVLDLATKAGQNEYQRIMKEIMPEILMSQANQKKEDPNGWYWMEKAGDPIPDPNAEAGFRLITVIKYWRRKDTKVPGHHGFGNFAPAVVNDVK